MHIINISVTHSQTHFIKCYTSRSVKYGQDEEYDKGFDSTRQSVGGGGMSACAKAAACLLITSLVIDTMNGAAVGLGPTTQRRLAGTVNDLAPDFPPMAYKWRLQGIEGGGELRTGATEQRTKYHVVSLSFSHATEGKPSV